MRFYGFIFILIFFVLTACGDSEPQPETPLETLQAYTRAFKKGDTARMKLFLSEGSIKMAQEEAKAQGATLDEVVKRETLFSESQNRVEFKNEKIDGERATIEVKNSYGSWDIVPFSKEDGIWKIAKDRYLEEQTKKAEEDMKKLDQQIMQGIPDAGAPTLDPMPTPTLPEASNSNAAPAP